MAFATLAPKEYETFRNQGMIGCEIKNYAILRAARVSYLKGENIKMHIKNQDLSRAFLISTYPLMSYISLIRASKTVIKYSGVIILIGCSILK